MLANVAFAAHPLTHRNAAWRSPVSGDPAATAIASTTPSIPANAAQHALFCTSTVTALHPAVFAAVSVEDTAFATRSTGSSSSSAAQDSGERAMLNTISAPACSLATSPASAAASISSATFGNASASSASPRFAATTVICASADMAAVMQGSSSHESSFTSLGIAPAEASSSDCVSPRAIELTV